MDNDTEPVAPPNVHLRDPDDYDTLRTNIYNGVKEELTSAFPMSYGGVRLELSDVDYADPEHFSIAEQKQALLNEKFLGRRLKGKLRLVNEADNTPLEEKELTLMKVPYLTSRGSMIHGGNEYTTIMQSRLLPGIYTRRQDNGEFETQFNIKPGTGVNFRVGLEPASSQYRLRVQAANLHLYSLLHDLGVPDEHLEKMWGSEVWQANKKKYDARVFDKAYARLVPRRDQKTELSREDKAAAIKQALDGMQVHGGVARKNLPNLFDLQKAASWRAMALGRQLAEEHFEKAAASMTFAPDLTPEAIITWAATLPEFQKVAAASQDFEPDLQPEDMQEAVQYLYGQHGPRLASMPEWPSAWFPEGAHPLGWIGWYSEYAGGKRSEDDERQIKRWKSFKARTVPGFVKNPTPRRAFALTNWAIDPLKLIEDAAAREKLKNDMDAYRASKWKAHHAKQAVFRAADYAAMATFLNREFKAGLDTAAPASELADQMIQFIETQDIDPGMLQVAQESRSGPSSVSDVPTVEAPTTKRACSLFPEELFLKVSAFAQTRDEEEKAETERQRQAEEDALELKELVASGGLLAGGLGVAALAGKAYSKPQVNAQFDRFVATTQSQPEAWSPEFNPQRMIQDYVTEGSRVMGSRVYGQPILEHVRRVREGLAHVPGVNDKWAWKTNFVAPPKEIAGDIDWSNPDLTRYVQLDPKGAVKGVNDSALHYIAFQSGPLTAYKQLWHEYDPSNLHKVDKLLNKWKASLPSDVRSQDRYDNFYGSFDDFVKTRDPKFWAHKQELEDSMGRTLRETSRTYADLGGYGRQLGVNIPKYVGLGAAAIGAGGLGYWLWKKYHKKQQAKGEQVEPVDMPDAEAQKAAALSSKGTAFTPAKAQAPKVPVAPEIDAKAVYQKLMDVKTPLQPVLNRAANDPNLNVGVPGFAARMWIRGQLRNYSDQTEAALRAQLSKLPEADVLKHIQANPSLFTGN